MITGYSQFSGNTAAILGRVQYRRIFKQPPGYYNQPTRQQAHKAKTEAKRRAHFERLAEEAEAALI